MRKGSATLSTHGGRAGAVRSRQCHVNCARGLKDLACRTSATGKRFIMHSRRERKGKLCCGSRYHLSIVVEYSLPKVGKPCTVRMAISLQVQHDFQDMCQKHSTKRRKWKLQVPHPPGLLMTAQGGGITPDIYIMVAFRRAFIPSTLFGHKRSILRAQARLEFLVWP